MLNFDKIPVMEQTITPEISAPETAQIQSQVRELIAEMQCANERIKKDQDEIQRLKARTRATLAALAAWKVN